MLKAGSLARAALIITDPQNDFLHPDGFLGRAGRRGLDDAAIAAIIANIRALAGAMRARGRPVVVVMTKFRADMVDCAWPHGWAKRVFGAERGFLANGAWGTEPVDSLDLAPEDIIIGKRGHGAFLGTPLDRMLANLGVETLILAGGPVSSSTSDSARAGVTLGYDVHVAADAVFPALASYPLTTQAQPLETAAILDQLGQGAPLAPAHAGTALIVIDMQNHFLHRGGARSDASPHAGAIANTAALAQAARAAGARVVWVTTGRRADRADSAMHRLREDFLSERGELLVDDTWAAELARGLAPREDDIRVVKRGASAFAFTPLHRVLRNLKVRRCVLAGGAVTGCLASSAREGAALGYEIAIAEDATYPARAPYLDVLRDYVDIRPSAWFIGEGFGLPGRGD